MLNTTKFTVFATELLKNHNLEVTSDDGTLICNTKTDADAAQLTQAVFSHERVSIGVSRKNSDWVLGGMEIVKNTDAGSGETLMYIENHSKQLRPISLIADQIEMGTFA